MIAEHLNPRQQRDGRFVHFFVHFDYDASRRLIRYTDQGGNVTQLSDEVFAAVAAQRAKRASKKET